MGLQEINVQECDNPRRAPATGFAAGVPASPQLLQ